MNHQIGDIFPDDNVVVVDSDALLLRDRKPCLAREMRNR